MARRSGRKGRILMDMTGSGAAVLLPFQAKWSLDASTDQIDVSSMDDTNKVYVSDLPDASGDFSGFWDDATNQTYTAATDGLARKFYLYPSFGDVPGTYWFGTVNVDFHIDGGIASAVNVSAKWSAATSIIKVGP